MPGRAPRSGRILGTDAELVGSTGYGRDARAIYLSVPLRHTHDRGLPHGLSPITPVRMLEYARVTHTLSLILDDLLPYLGAFRLYFISP